MNGKAIAFTIAVTIILAAACSYRPHNSIDILELRGHITTCPIHRAKLIDAIVPLDKKSFCTDEYLQAVMDEFPHSDKVVYIGRWDTTPTESRARIEYCPRCRKAEESWLKRNPQHQPRIAGDKDILQISQQVDQKRWSCSIHKEPFGWRLTAVKHSIKLAPEYVKARQRFFPNSFFIVTMPADDGPRFAAMGFCWKCRQAERTWCIKNPNLCIAVPPDIKIIAR